jgi:hypothetical protein
MSSSSASGRATAPPSSSAPDSRFSASISTASFTMFITVQFRNRRRMRSRSFCAVSSGFVVMPPRGQSRWQLPHWLQPNATALPMLASMSASAPAISTFSMSVSSRSPPEANSRVPPLAPNGAPLSSRIERSSPRPSRSTFSITSAWCVCRIVRKMSGQPTCEESAW